MCSSLAIFPLQVSARSHPPVQAPVNRAWDHSLSFWSPFIPFPLQHTHTHPYLYVSLLTIPLFLHLLPPFSETTMVQLFVYMSFSSQPPFTILSPHNTSSFHFTLYHTTHYRNYYGSVICQNKKSRFCLSSMVLYWRWFPFLLLPLNPSCYRPEFCIQTLSHDLHLTNLYLCGIIAVKLLLNQVLVVDPRKRLTLTQVLPHRNSFSTAIIHIFYIYNDWS